MFGRIAVGKRPERPPVYLSACLIAKNEARYLLEWIAFHQVVGFEYFYIYDNDSDDDTASILRILEAHGVCKYIKWDRAFFPENPQANAYRHAVKNYADRTTWLAIIDADEFVVPLSSDRVDTILREHFADAASVLCNWKVFGSSGLETNDGRFCIERFRNCSELSYHSNKHVKSICKPPLVETAYIHNHYMTTGPIVLSDGSPMTPERDQTSATAVYGHLQINHYFCKSRSEFMEKRMKGLAEYPLDHPTAIRPLAMFADADRNECRDDRAFSFLADVRQAYRRLASLTGAKPV